MVDTTEFSVSEFLQTVNAGLKSFKATIVGEVTGRVNRRGNVTYFSLHDAVEDAVLPCMGFNSILDRLGIEIKEGMLIKVAGNPEVWPRTGGFSFKAFEVLLTGAGDLKRQFEMLMKKLEAEGLFAPEHKQALPRFITKIGLITATDREAMNDFLKHLAPCGLSTNLYDVRVEGISAIEQICEAIAWFNEYASDTEVLVLTRGGGSLESLQAFNAEAVARAIFASRIPIISAIGHERDVTIADFAADVRASTPTHAAKIIAEDWLTAPLLLREQEQSLSAQASQLVQNYQHRLEMHTSSWKSAFDNFFKLLHFKLLNLERSLTIASPELKLKQGYSIIRDQNEQVIKSVAKLAQGDIVEAQLHHGKAKFQFQKSV